MDELDLIKQCTQKITSIEGTQALKQCLRDVDFVVKDKLGDVGDDTAAGHCIPKPDGRIEVAIKRSQLKDGVTWDLYNTIAHELIHVTQLKDRKLSPFFALHEGAMQSAKLNFLFEMDAYVKAESIMFDLEKKEAVKSPTASPNLSTQIDNLYHQAIEQGYSHDSGEAQNVLFNSLVSNEQLAYNYIFSRTYGDLTYHPTKLTK